MIFASRARLSLSLETHSIHPYLIHKKIIISAKSKAENPRTFQNINLDPQIFQKKKAAILNRSKTKKRNHVIQASLVESVMKFWQKSNKHKKNGMPAFRER